MQLISSKQGSSESFYNYNGHGDVVQLTNSSGSITKQYSYDAFGVEIDKDNTDTNPFRYCGEYYDKESGSIYLRARYYAPSIGRFITEDPIRDGLNWYSYCEGDSIKFIDQSGMIPEEEASEIISRNAYAINNAGEYYGVNPAIVAACIYSELVLNYNWVDDLTDRMFYWADTSIGIGQVRISTAKKVEDAGYIAKTEIKAYEFSVYGFMPIWTAYGYRENEVIATSREEAISYRLSSESENINYVAAYLAYIQDIWKDVYPDIGGKTDILATLYNVGEYGVQGVNSNPRSNEFGDYAKSNYYFMQGLLNGTMIYLS